MGFDSLDLGHVDDDFSIAPQLHPSDMEALREMGYRSVLVMRPDHEEAGQPDHVQITNAAREAGLQARYQPVETRTLGPADVRVFEQNFAAMPKPMVAFCRTGRRAMTVWALAMSGTRPAGDILEAGMRVGHDLGDLAPVLDKG